MLHPHCGRVRFLWKGVKVFAKIQHSSGAVAARLYYGEGLDGRFLLWLWKITALTVMPWLEI